MFFQNKYFLFLIVKIMILLIIGFKIDIFTTINKYIYNITVPYFFYETKHNKDISLVDISHISQEELLKILDIVNIHNPKLIVADIFHSDNLVKENFLQNILNKNILFISVDKISIFDSLFTQENSKYLKFYDIQKLYGKNVYTSKDFSDSRNLENYFSIKNDFENNQYFINHNGNYPFIKIDKKDILEDNIVPDFFENKIVLLSSFNNKYALSDIPSKQEDKFLHEEYLASLISSGLSNSWLYLFSMIEYILFMTTITILWVFVAYKRIHNNIFLLGIFSLLTPFLAYWMCITYLNILLPISDLIFVSLVTSYLMHRHWQNLRIRDEGSILINISKRLQEKVVYKTFFNTDEYWNDLIILTNQLFNMQKSILFEKVPNDTRIKEIVSFNCDFTAINEMRRDYSREPFLTAIKNKSVVQSSRKFFEETFEDELEFITPFMYQNEIIGFWVFTINELEKKSIINFEATINSCAREISELLVQRNSFIKEKNNHKKNKLQKFLNMEISDSNIIELKKDLTIIEKRMLLTEIIFDNMYENTIIYNLFGKIIQINQRMNEILQNEEIMAYNLTAGDMIAKLTNLSIKEAKELIRDVIFNQTETKCYINLKNSDKKYLLIVSSLTKDEISDNFSANYIFDTFGIVLELIDLEFIQKSIDIKENIINSSILKNRDNLEKILQSSDISSSDISKKIEEILLSQNELLTYINQDLRDDTSTYPIFISPYIQAAIEDIKKQYKTKQLSFDFDDKEKLPFVLVYIKIIDNHLNNLLSLLAIDSEEGGKISIDIKKNQDYLQIEMLSNGFGLPQDELDRYLNSEESILIYQKLIQTSKELTNCSAKLTFNSELGKGIKIILSLKISNL